MVVTFIGKDTTKEITFGEVLGMVLNEMAQEVNKHMNP